MSNKSLKQQFEELNEKIEKLNYLLTKINSKIEKIQNQKLKNEHNPKIDKPNIYNINISEKGEYENKKIKLWNFKKVMKF